MDQNKNTQGQQGQGQKQGQPNQGQRQGSQGNQNQNTGNRGNMGSQERGTGSQGERNSSGISNRGMNESEEQADLPSRGSIDEDELDQSER